MKKILLLISCIFVSFSSTFAAGLNAYAFGAGYIYDANTNKLHINWSQQAQAARVTIVALDGDNRYVLAEYNNLGAARHEYIIDLWDAVAAGMPTNTDLEVAIEVRTADRTKHEFVKKIDFQWPFSIDIDRNPYSKYFGLMYVGQMNGSKDRGVYVLDQQGGVASSVQIDEDINKSFSSQNWFTYTHAVPFMVRTLQDGTGRLLISSSDRSQNTHLWLATPQTGDAVPVYSEWTNVITSTQLKNWTGHSVSTDKFANAGLDIRENGDYWDILLYMATVNSNTENHDAGNAYSGMYRVAKTSTDLIGGIYTSYTAPTPNTSYSSGYKPHDVISNAYTASMLNASANFDKFGGVLYNATSENDNQEESAFIHKTLGGKFKSDYKDETYLQRNKARTKGARFSPDFSKLAIAQGRMADEMRIYDVTQADGNSHVVLSNGQSVNIITGTSGVNYDDRVFAHDIAWDYAKNVYVSVRNEGSKYGIYAVATDLNGEPITTPIKGTPLNVNCPEGEFTISLSSNIDAGATLTGAGTYASCTAVTVTAVPDNQYKFIRWTEGGQEVSREKSYTFYATRDRNLVAEFEYAEYDVTYYHLLANDVDVLGWDMNNENLWALFMAYFNDYNISYRGVQNNSGADRASQNIKAVLTFIDGTNAINYISEFMTNDRSQMKWLGNYILSVASSQGKSISTAKDWRANVCAFFKCEKQPTNGSGYYDSSYGVSADFTEKGNSTYWHHYYTQHVGRLNPILNYKDVLPSTIVELNPIVTSSGRATYPTWYNCNVDGKLLGWYYGDDLNKAIVHEVNQSGALYATWVDKTISENKDNTDVIRLMQNSGYAGTPHRLTVERKLQAGMYNTICFPFTVYIDGEGGKSGLAAEHPLKEATVLNLIGKDELYDESGDPVVVLNFEPVNKLEAGKPYLIKLAEDQPSITEPINFTGITYDDLTYINGNQTITIDDATISFHAMINPGNIPAEAVILVADNRLATITASEPMNGLRGYFTIDDPYLQSVAKAGRLYLSVKKPVTTSIPIAPEAEQQTKPEVRKIMRDGQIYILRGNEVYTITGHRVK